MSDRIHAAGGEVIAIGVDGEERQSAMFARWPAPHVRYVADPGGDRFLQPLDLEAGSVLVEFALGDDGCFEVRSNNAGAMEGSTVHCSGATATNNAWSSVDHASLRAPLRTVDVHALYVGFDAIGLQYGPGYRTLVRAWGGSSTAALLMVMMMQRLLQTD